MCVRTDEASNGAAASSDNGEFTLVSDEVDKNPTEDTGGSGSIGVECSHHSSDCAVDGRPTLKLLVHDHSDRPTDATYVEAEPTEPNQNSAEEDQSSVVWSSM